MANTAGTRTRRAPSAATIEKQIRLRGMRGFFQHLRAAVVLALVLTVAILIHRTGLTVFISAVFVANLVLGAIDLIAWQGWEVKK